MITMTKTGTIDSPTKTTVPVEHYISAAGDEIPGLVVDIDLASLGVGSRYSFDSVLQIEDGTITVLCYPDEDDEGWQRLDEVGEW
jgi:hypothetical protein